MNVDASGDERPQTADAKRILDEAERQILSSPTGKLRVVDVAAALNMSHANVYRFFASREALLDGLVDRWLTDGRVRALNAVAAHELAGDQLKHILLSLHVQTRDKIASAPGVIDIYVRAMTKRTAAVERLRAFIVQTCKERLESGITSGEFAIRSTQIPGALAVLEASIRKFTHPYLIAEGLPDDTPAEAERVLDFFIGALRTAPHLFPDA